MKTLRYSFILLIFGFMAQSCHKEVTIKLDSTYEGQLFIESILFPGEKPKVYLSRSLPFFNEKVTPQQVFARGAAVTISNGLETDLLQPDSTFDKFRCRWAPYYHGTREAVYGETYELSVTYEGKTYTAETTINQSRIEIDDIEYTPEFYDVYGGHDGVIMRFDDIPGEANFYRFQMNRMIDTSRHHAHVLDVLDNNCTNGEKFLVVDLGRTVFSDENIDGQPVELYIEVSFEYQKGDSAYIYMQTLDENAAAFYREIDNQLQSILNPFVEPVFLKSNIDGAPGVFGSGVRSDPVLFIYPQDNP